MMMHPQQVLPRGSLQHPPRRLPHLLFLLFLFSLTSCSSGVAAQAKGEPSVPLLGAIPDTTFRCRGHSAGYYADPDTGCQVYHMCDTLERQYSYLCPNYTLFNQKFMVCDHWYMVDCAISQSFYHLNSHIGEVPGDGEGAEEQNSITAGEQQDALSRKDKTLTTHTSLTGSSYPTHTPFTSSSLPTRSPFTSSSLPTRSPFTGSSLPTHTPFTGSSLPTHTPFTGLLLRAQSPFTSSSLPTHSPFISSSLLPQRPASSKPQSSPVKEAKEVQRSSLSTQPGTRPHKTIVPQSSNKPVMLPTSQMVTLPRQSLTTLRQVVTPLRGSITPLKQSVTPKHSFIPPRQSVTTSRQSATPPRQHVTPTTQSVTLPRELVTPARRQSVTPSTSQSVIPPKQLVTPQITQLSGQLITQATRHPLIQFTTNVTPSVPLEVQTPSSTLLIPQNISLKSSAAGSPNVDAVTERDQKSKAVPINSTRPSEDLSLSAINNFTIPNSTKTNTDGFLEGNPSTLTELPSTALPMMPGSVARSPGDRFSFTSSRKQKPVLTPEDLQRLVFQPLLAQPLTKIRTILTNAPTVVPINPAQAASNLTDGHHHHLSMRIEFPASIVPEDSSSRSSADVKLSNTQDIHVPSIFIQPPSVSSSSNIPLPFLIPPSRNFTPIIHVKQEFPTPLVTPNRDTNQRTSPRDTFLPGAQHLHFPPSASRGHRDFFIPTAEFSLLIPELPQNTVEVPEPDFSHAPSNHHDHHHHGNHMTMVFPAPIEPSKMKELKLNPECPRCHPEFLKPGQCHPCVVIK